MKAADLIGTWRLRTWKNVGSDGSSVDPLGERPVGYIFSNHDGYMSVEIMAAGRVPYAEADAFGGTLGERSEAISTYLSYSGPYDVLPDQNTVIHHIEVCSYPNWIGNAQVRRRATRSQTSPPGDRQPAGMESGARGAEGTGEASHLAAMFWPETLFTESVTQGAPRLRERSSRREVGVTERFA